MHYKYATVFKLMNQKHLGIYKDILYMLNCTTVLVIENIYFIISLNYFKLDAD